MKKLLLTIALILSCSFAFADYDETDGTIEYYTDAPTPVLVMSITYKIIVKEGIRTEKITVTKSPSENTTQKQIDECVQKEYALRKHVKES